MKFILDLWYVWIIGLMALPAIIVLSQLSSINAAIADKNKNPEAIAKLFLSPFSLTISIVGGIGTFICFIFFIASVLMAIVQQIKG